MKPSRISFLLLCFWLVLHPFADASGDILGDIILYDGEPGSAPLIGGNWAAGEGGTIMPNDNGFWGTWSFVSSPVSHSIRALATTGRNTLSKTTE